MRGLPPLPDDVLRLRVSIGLEGADFEIEQHFYAPGSIAWDYSNFQEFNQGWATFCEPHLLSVMPSDSGFDVFRLSRFGGLPFQYVNTLAVNNGAGTSAAPWNCALCLTWRTEVAGYSARARNRLPLVNEVVNVRKQLIDQSFVAFAQLKLDEYILATNNITVSGQSTPSFVAVSRASHGAPRSSSVFSPILSGNVSMHAATLARRTSSAR